MNASKSNKLQDKFAHQDARNTIDTTLPKKGIKKVLAFLGPAYLVSVGYMDPGNWATDLQGGSQFGYKLIWILLMSNVIALLLQSLAVRLGVVRRLDLAQANRETYPPLINFFLYLLAELAIAACDLAEVLGMAIGLNLLCGLPMIWGVTITVLDTFLLFYLEKLGMRKMEAFIIVLISIIGGSFLIELLFAKPDFTELAKGFIPSKMSNEELYVAIGIIGATVMPHNLYLHSSLVQTRKIKQDPTSIKKALKFNLLDSTIALNAAFFVNAAILVLAAAVFFKSGHTEIAEIQDAHKLLAPMLGSKLAPMLFAIALIAAGQSSTVTGTLAGQIVMEGYLHLRINPLIRRLITRLLAILPAVITILVYGDSEINALLIFSQVILSLQLGFAVIPLIFFVSDKKKMGLFAISTKTKIASWLVALILVYLNGKLVFDSIADYFQQEGHLLTKALILVFTAGFALLFVMMILIPLRKKHTKPIGNIHGLEKRLESKEMNVAPFKTIAIALDFSGQDEQLMAHAIDQGGKDGVYILIHVVETATAAYLGANTDDDESRGDKKQITGYVESLQKFGYHAIPVLAYRNRVTEIVRITQSYQADLLLMGSHKHTGVKDIIYGETIDKVRHQLTIPVMIIA